MSGFAPLSNRSFTVEEFPFRITANGVGPDAGSGLLIIDGPPLRYSASLILSRAGGVAPASI